VTLLYGGPDQLIPLASVLSTLSGVALVFWGKIVQALQKLGSWISTKFNLENKPQA